MNIKIKWLGGIFACTAILSIAGCGGGSSTPAGPDIPPVTKIISGTAAVGAPLVGTVTVKDALGVTRGPTPIGTNGTYSADVTGLTAPFVFRAAGSANGQTYIVHSVATAADVDGKINITQLTDLVVANIAGQIAQNYFDKFELDSNASAASKDAVDAEVSKLRDKLLPVLMALGVEAGVDLLRTPFTPLASALDTALDAIQVSIDSNTNMATISTLVNAITITDDLRTKAAAEANSPTLSAENVTAATVATGASDAVLVKKALTDFIAKFATGLPVVAELTPLLTSGFLGDDANRTRFLEQMSTESNLVGGAFTDIAIHQIDYANVNGVTARVSFTVKNKQGVELGRLNNWRVRKSLTDSLWRLHGDQRMLALEGFSVMQKFISRPEFSAGSCVSVSFNFNIEDIDNTNNGAAASMSYILVKGAGLPPDGLRYNRPTLSGRWKIASTTSTNYQIATNCGGSSIVADAGIAAIPDDSLYTLTAYDSANVKVDFPFATDGNYVLKIPRRPLTLAETAASSAFPVIAPDTLSAFSSLVAGTLQFDASNINPAKSSWVRLVQNTSLSDKTRDIENTAIPTADGKVKTSFSLTALAAGDSLTSRTLWIESPDAHRRNMQTFYRQ